MSGDPFTLNYDHGADVLYVSTERFGPAHGVEGEAPGVVWRYRDDDDTLVGATVMDFRGYWKPRLPQLAAELAGRFGITRSAAEKVLLAAAS